MTNLEFLYRKVVALLICSLLPSGIYAETLLAEGVREFEEFRLRQLQTVQIDTGLEPFTTDGCSGNLSNGWEALGQVLPAFAGKFGQKPPWELCCVAHDKQYWKGEVTDGFNRRAEADQELKQCVAATGDRLAPELSRKYSLSEEKIQTAFSTVSVLMYKAVRIGGQPCSLLPWRWGYGWPKCAFATVEGSPAEFSDLKTDEQIVFFNTAAWLDPDKTHWNLPVHAWIYEPASSEIRKAIFAGLLENSFGLIANSETEANFDRRTNLLIADNERGKKLVVRIAGQDIVLPASKENGHVYSVLKIPVELIDANADRGRIRFLAITAAHEKRRFEIDAQLVSSRGISVISDIDDTVKITGVTDHRQLLENTFFKKFKVVAGMPELYQKLVSGGARIHFVSSSPWQLYDPLREFFVEAGFPWATLDLKSIRFRDDTFFNLFKKGTETKPEQIVPILKRYPARKFILIGDSGEQDPEVYGEIARRFPNSIQRILIRNINSDKAEDARYRKAFNSVPNNKWQLFDKPDQLSARELLHTAQ